MAANVVPPPLPQAQIPLPLSACLPTSITPAPPRPRPHLIPEILAIVVAAIALFTTAAAHGIHILGGSLVARHLSRCSFPPPVRIPIPFLTIICFIKVEPFHA